MSIENPLPHPSELAVLQLLWERGPLTVKEVHEALTTNSEKPIIYTTVLKTMQLMLEKGMLERQSSLGRKHIYVATLSQESTQDKLLDTFLQRFGGSAKSLVMRALGNLSTTKADIDELKNLIQTIENNQKEGE
jgi:BlaI family transcriptional regulator, penicillinase repressor